MDSRNVSIFSQSFFVPGKRKESKLSLTCKPKNQLKRPAENPLSKQEASSNKLEDGHTSGDFSRTNSTEMEKFLEKFKNPRKSGRVSSNRNLKGIGTALHKEDGGMSKISSPETEESDFKEPYLPSSDVSKESVSAKESKRIMPLSETKSTDSVANFSEENGKCVEKSNDRDDVRSEPSEPNILLCPLCWRPFDCKDAQFTHMKACAAKHNVSTKQLLELLELIQKQEEERKVLGLPLLPSTIARKVKKESIVSSIKPKSALDGNIQLGIALSVSLKEAELQKERDYLLEAGLFDEVKEKGLLPDQVENHPLPTAPIFLSVGKKGCNTGIGLPKRKKCNKFGQGGRVPTLLKRTTEDREKLITEKVAIILVGDEQLNASLSLDDKENLPTWKVKSNMLRKYLDEEQIWWKMAGMPPSSSSKDQFYVSCLSNFISPCKVVVGSKLKHLSQIPGRDFSPEKVPSIKLPDCEISREVGINLFVSSSKDLRLDYNVNIEKKDAKRSLFAESPLYTEQNTLTRDWIMLVGNSEMSDVTIYTHGERKIPAHKLVFFARCPVILKDLVEEEMRGQKSSMLLWIDTCHAAAFVFLKYIYAGIFNETEAKSKKVLENLNLLAERYEVIDLLAVLAQVCCSKEEEENSIYASNGKVNKTVNFGGKTSPSFVVDDEDGFYRTKNGTDLIMKDSDVFLDEQDKKSSVCTSTTATKEERCSYVDDESCAPSRSLEESYSCQGVHACGINIHDDDTRTNSPCVSPNVSDLGRNSPDIFQVSKMINSPASVEILEDKPENSEELVISEKSSQESRESIEYLVSLMEKDSSLTKSTEDDPQESDNVGSPDSKENLPEQISINSHISESPSFVKTNRSCSDLTDSIPPETPLLRKEVEELVISSTPVVQVLKAFGKCGNFTTKDETMTFSEVKRKLTSLNKSDPASPNPKKICVEADKDNKVMESGEREMVDLTLSGSNSEDVAENITSNVSVCSTIPPPGMDLDTLTPSKDAVTPSSPAASPCGAYISNIWDDFDYVPDIHQVDFDGSICASQKSFIEKENEEMCNTNNSNSKEKDLPNELIAIASPKVDDDDDVILIDEEEAEKGMFSPFKSVKGSPEKEVDITEKLLNASFNKVDDSIFWRDENEPKEEIEKSNSLVPCQTPGRCFNAAGLKKNTPKTPVYLKKANVTPLADYSAMKTPMLHKELDRYGIKHLRKNQAKQLLRHIYNELHPVVSDETESSGKSSKDATSREKEKAPVAKEKGSSDNKVINKKKITFESLDSSSEELSSSEESSDSNSDFMVMEESIYEPQLESPVKSQTLSQKGACVDIPTAMRKLIESDSAFHRKILLYEPIWLNEIKAALKANGAKFNLKQLMDYLDEQCITIRIAQGNRHQRKRKTKKAFSLSQPCSQKRKNKEPISCSQPS